MPQASPAGSSLATLSEVPGTELRQLQATFDSFREFVTRYSPWLSDSCIFVETLEAVPVGAPVRLEIFLCDRPLLVRALGQVDWVRTEEDDAEEGPPGVAINITYLDPASARLIDSIFRLYTGEQSAAMGKDVVETWELDVESLIDQAFPGGIEPGSAPEGVAPAAASSDEAPADTAPLDEAPTDEAPTDEAPTDEAPADMADLAPPEVASPDADLDWTLPEGVVVADPGAASDAGATPADAPAAASSDRDSLDWTLPEGVVVADPGAAAATAPEAASPDRDSLDWTLPEGVVVAEPGPPPAEDPGAALGELGEVEMPEVELPEVAGLPDELEVPVELEEFEVPEVGLPDELEMPIELEEEPAMPQAPEVLQEPAMPVAEPPAPIEPPPAVEPPAWAGSDVAALSAAALSSAVLAGAAGSADADATFGGSDQAVVPKASEPATEEDPEWEARLSSAFSEYDEVEPAQDVVAQDMTYQEPAAAEVSGFGFGLVEEPTVTVDEVAEEALPPLLDDTATYPAAAPEIESDPARTMRVPTMPVAPMSAAPEPAAPEPAVPEPAAPEPAAPEPAAPMPAAPVPAAPAYDVPAPAAQVHAPVAPSPEVPAAVAQAELRGRAADMPHPVAGAAAADASDASFLRRSLMTFVLAVVAIGVLFFWFRGRQATPAVGGPVAQVPAGSAPAPQPVVPPAETAAPPEASGAAPSEAAPSTAVTAPPGTPPAVEPPPIEPLPAAAPSVAAPSVAAPSEEPPAALVEPAVASPEPPAVEPTPAAAQDPAAIVGAVEQRIKAWALAWSQQQPAAYIECYAPDFSPAGTGRRAWEQQRAARIKAPASILVQAKDISVTVLDASRAQATFYQDYETDTKHLYTWKTMELSRLPEGWRIVNERVGR